MLAKFPKDQNSIGISSIKYLKLMFLYFKIMHKNKFMNQIVSLNDCLEAKWKNIEVKDLHMVFIDLEKAYDMWWVLKNKEEFLLRFMTKCVVKYLF